MLYIIENGCKWRALPKKYGNCHDAPEGRKLLGTTASEEDNFLFMNRAYEDDKTVLWL
ncbi:MAG: transposase [Lachnospiraceae bacterium]|nr:transposase [Lachnospiraceae bacterium]